MLDREGPAICSYGLNDDVGSCREHIRCKPISLYKLWKLQFEPSDQHPRGGVQKGERRDLQKCDYPIQGWGVQIIKLPNPPYPLDVDPMTHIEVSIVFTDMLVCT